jgi:hypothetical protein
VRRRALARKLGRPPRRKSNASSRPKKVCSGRSGQPRS